jgi:hypothetical protein
MASSSDDLVISSECRAGSGKCGILVKNTPEKEEIQKAEVYRPTGSDHVQSPTSERLMVINGNNKA